MYPKDDSTTILIVGGDKAQYPDPAALKRQRPATDLRFLRATDDVLAVCRDHAPALIVIDLRQVEAPLGLTANILAADLPLDPTIIMVGDDVLPEQRTQAIELGVMEVMERPGTVDELRLRLLSHAHLRHRLALADQCAQDRMQKLTEASALLKVAERRLLDRNGPPSTDGRRSTEVVADAAHELRTPLHAIIGFSELIRDEAHGPHADPRYIEYAVDIHQAAAHMLTVVGGTLDLARAEAGADTLDVREIDIGATVRDSARMLRQLADGNGIDLQVNIPDIPLRIRTDPDKIRQIVINLASNAIKFTPTGGCVTVAVEGVDDGGAIILVIRDTGIGIADRDLPTAMKPFGQVRRPGQTHPKGAGLGLPLTRRFVEMLGGLLDISSVPGKGTVVSVRLPASVPSDGPAG